VDCWIITIRTIRSNTGFAREEGIDKGEHHRDDSFLFWQKYTAIFVILVASNHNQILDSAEDRRTMLSNDDNHQCASHFWRGRDDTLISFCISVRPSSQYSLEWRSPKFYRTLLRMSSCKKQIQNQIRDSSLVGHPYLKNGMVFSSSLARDAEGEHSSSASVGGRVLSLTSAISPMFPLQIFSVMIMRKDSYCRILCVWVMGDGLKQIAGRSLGIICSFGGVTTTRYKPLST
jgi:hypothetical protein